MSAIVQDRLRRRPRAASRAGRPPLGRRRRGARPRQCRGTRPRHLAPDDRPALPDADHGASASVARRTGCPGSTSPGPWPPSVLAVTRFAVGRRGVRRRPRLLRRVRRGRQDKLALKPANLSFEQAAVVPISAATALQALTDAGRVESGQRVLVIGASGGVGCYAVQLAKALGAEVTGVASTGSSTWCARSEPTTSSTTRATTSPTGAHATT